MPEVPEQVEELPVGHFWAFRQRSGVCLFARTLPPTWLLALSPLTVPPQAPAVATAAVPGRLIYQFSLSGNGSPIEE